jgi:hypothetical protein
LRIRLIYVWIVEEAPFMPFNHPGPFTKEEDSKATAA